MNGFLLILLVMVPYVMFLLVVYGISVFLTGLVFNREKYKRFTKRKTKKTA